MNAKEIPINIFLAAMNYLNLRKQDLPELTSINWTVLQRTLSGEIPYRNGREIILLRFFEKQGVKITEQDGTYTMVLPKTIPELKDVKPLTSKELSNLESEQSSLSGYTSLPEDLQQNIQYYLKSKQGYYLDLSPTQLDTIYDFPMEGLQGDTGVKKVRTLDILVRKRFLEKTTLPGESGDSGLYLLSTEGRALKAEMHAIAGGKPVKKPVKKKKEPKKGAKKPGRPAKKDK